MKVICRVCQKKTIYNSTLGVYYCPNHGYETKFEDVHDYMEEMVTNLEQMRVLI